MNIAKESRIASNSILHRRFRILLAAKEISLQLGGHCPRYLRHPLNHIQVSPYIWQACTFLVDIPDCHCLKQSAKVFFGHCSRYAAPLSSTNTGLDTFFSFISFPTSIPSTTSSTSSPQPGYLPFTYCNLFDHLPWLPCASIRCWNCLSSNPVSSQ